MYLNHPLVPGFAVTLRYGEERDRDYLGSIFSELWAEIPNKDRAAILSRGYGDIVVDVLDKQAFDKAFDNLSNTGGDFRLKRNVVDTYPRAALLYLVAHRLAQRMVDFTFPDTAARQNEPRGITRRRIATVLERWSCPEKPTLEYTPADEVRIRAIFGTLPPVGGDS